VVVKLEHDESIENSLRLVDVLITQDAGVLQYVFWFVAWAD